MSCGPEGHRGLGLKPQLETRCPGRPERQAGREQGGLLWQAGRAGGTQEGPSTLPLVPLSVPVPTTPGTHTPGYPPHPVPTTRTPVPQHGSARRAGSGCRASRPGGVGPPGPYGWLALRPLALVGPSGPLYLDTLATRCQRAFTGPITRLQGAGRYTLSGGSQLPT